MIPYRLWRVPLFLRSTQIYYLTVRDDVFVSISPLRPRVYDRKVCILAPCTVHEKDCSDIRTISITTCLLSTPTVPRFFTTNKNGISLLFHQILFRQSSIGQIRLYLISFSTVGDELGYAATNPGYGIYTAYRIVRSQAQHTSESKTTTTAPTMFPQSSLNFETFGSGGGSDSGFQSRRDPYDCFSTITHHRHPAMVRYYNIVDDSLQYLKFSFLRP